MTVRTPKKIAIIGGGAAGMMAAASLLEGSSLEELEIHLFEKNKQLGVKVALSGGGRCNVTTGITDPKILHSKYVRGSDFLKPAFAAFPPQKVRAWFEEHGVPLKEEADQRVFPVSDIGRDVVAAFERIFTNPRIQLHYLEGIKEVALQQNAKFWLQSLKQSYLFDILILTSGGNAYAHTGSTGDGYNFAQNLGHSITKLGPSLNSFETKESWCKELAGLSFPNAQFKATLSNGVKVRAQGPMLFTHFGISGPTVFALAAHLAHEKIAPATPLTINFLPEIGKDFGFWDNALLEATAESGPKQIVNCLATLLPQRFTEKLLTIAAIPTHKKSAELTKSERQKIAHLLAGELNITLLSRRTGDEFVTAGGVNLSEVERKTMRSKILPELYFAGEILDIDGLTGGFNLQAAWATGRLAGNSILKYLED